MEVRGIHREETKRGREEDIEDTWHKCCLLGHKSSTSSFTVRVRDGAAPLGHSVSTVFKDGGPRNKYADLQIAKVNVMCQLRDAHLAGETLFLAVSEMVFPQR